MQLKISSPEGTMADTAALFLGPPGPYAGYVIGVSPLAAVLLLNQEILPDAGGVFGRPSRMQ